MMQEWKTVWNGWAIKKDAWIVNSFKLRPAACSRIQAGKQNINM
jgi:hypothetical protein